MSRRSQSERTNRFRSDRVTGDLLADAEPQRVSRRTSIDEEPQHTACGGEVVGRHERLDQAVELLLGIAHRTSSSSALVREGEVDPPAVVGRRHSIDESGADHTVDKTARTAGFADESAPDIDQRHAACMLEHPENLSLRRCQSKRTEQVGEHATALPLGPEHQVPKLFAGIHHAERSSSSPVDEMSVTKSTMVSA